MEDGSSEELHRSWLKPQLSDSCKLMNRAVVMDFLKQNIEMIQNLKSIWGRCIKLCVTCQNTCSVVPFRS